MPKSDVVLAINNRVAGGAAGVISPPAMAVIGVTDHGSLTGLGDDDHGQYHNDARGDARYVPLARTVSAGAGLINGGALSGNITLDVGAGLGITVNANDVALASTVAGNGLTYASGVLNIGAGAGITINTDDVALTTPGSLSVSSSNSASGNHTHAVTASADVGTSPAAALLKSTAGGGLTLGSATTNQVASLAAFNSGFAGSGFRADYGVTTANRATLELDDLTVRGRMRIYELLIQQIRATNGSLFVSSSSRVVELSGGANPLWTVNGNQLTFNGSNATLSVTHYVISTVQTTGATDNGTSDNRMYHGFLVGDLIRAQRVRWNGSTFAGVIQSNMEVTSVANLYTYGAILISGDAAAVGYDYVRLGSISDTTRRGTVYISSDDSNGPLIDIVDGVASFSDWNSAGAIKARLGKLSGITDADFGGTLSGYGLYSTNVYLKGNVYATSGQFSGTVYASAGSFSGTVTATTGTIGGWTLGATSLTAGTGTSTVGLDSGGTNPAFYAGSATPGIAPFRVSKDGHLVSEDAAFGDFTIDSAGAYVSAPNVTYGLSTNGYKFRYGGGVAAGLSATYDTSSAALYIDNNASGTNGDTPKYNISSSVLVRSMANGSGKTSSTELRAIHGATSTILSLTNDGTNQAAKIYADTLTFNDNTIWHAGNDGHSAGGTGPDADLLDGQQGSYYAPIASPGFTGTPVAEQYAVPTLSAHPTVASGRTAMYVKDTSGTKRLVFAFNDGGTMRYLYANLSGITGAGAVAWTGHTTAP